MRIAIYCRVSKSDESQDPTNQPLKLRMPHSHLHLTRISLVGVGCFLKQWWNVWSRRSLIHLSAFSFSISIIQSDILPIWNLLMYWSIAFRIRCSQFYARKTGSEHRFSNISDYCVLTPVLWVNWKFNLTVFWFDAVLTGNYGAL